MTSPSGPRLLAVAEDKARLLGQADGRLGPGGGAPVRDGRASPRPCRGAGRAAGGGPWVGPARPAAGVLLGAGTERRRRLAGAQPAPWEVETLVAAGLEPDDALAPATVNGGRLLGQPGAGVISLAVAAKQPEPHRL